MWNYKKILINILIICMLLSPISVYAKETTIISDESRIIINANLDNETDYKPNVTFRYNKDEQKALENAPEIGCKAAYIAEPITGKVIYEKNAHEVLYPASTTKILTALLVLENCELTDIAEVSSNAINLVPDGYTNAMLQAGEKLSISDLLYALLIPSANEAANVLAEHVGGSVKEFAELCNNRAKELGCESLHFVNPNGIHDDNHYCTAYDLYLIAKECRKYDIFNEIVKTKSFTLPATNVYSGEDRTFKNTNELLLPGTYYYSNCTGIKTGYTTPAGQCLVASSSFNGIDLISVVLGGKTNSQGLNERFYDTKQLFEFVYDNYSINKIAEYGYSVATIDVCKATKDTSILDVIVDTDISTIVPNDINKDNVFSSISINENIVAPIKQNQVLGQITFTADGLIYTTNIIASHPVDKIPYELYNLIVVCAIILTLFIFIILLKVFKKHRKSVLVVALIILIIEGFCLFYIMKDFSDISITKTTITSSLINNNQLVIEKIN